MAAAGSLYVVAKDLRALLPQPAIAEGCEPPSLTIRPAQPLFFSDLDTYVHHFLRLHGPRRLHKKYTNDFVPQC